MTHAMKKTIALLLTLLLFVQLLPMTLAASKETDEGTSAFSGSLSTSQDLLFDFSNNAAAQTRYKSSAYGGYNFDQETNGYWATGYNGTNTNYSISNANGTLRVNITEGSDANGTYGPWLKTTNTYGRLPSSNSSTYQYYPLNYDPSAAQCIKIRFKLNNCTIPTGTTPRFVFEYYYTSGSTYSYKNNIYSDFSYQNNVYQTLTIPLNSTFRNADAIKGFGLRLRNVKATSGTLYIDYIYIGKDTSYKVTSHNDMTFLSQKDVPIASGVNETTVLLKNRDSQPVAGYFATVSPSAMFTFKASYPGYYTAGSSVASRAALAPNLPLTGATTTKQASNYESVFGEEVVFATNADFFNMDTFQPRGYLVMEGNLIQNYGTRQTPYFAVLKDGSYAIRPYGSPLGDVKEAVSGYQWLVRDGAVVKNNDEERHPRTAIGLKADQTVIVFTADGRQEGYSMGMTLQELANLMYAAGCVDAINLDGGGSSTFVSAYSGTTNQVIRNKPCDSTGERVVSTALLLVPATCKHKFTSNSYAVHEDGTHTTACTSCGEKITISHSYTDGLCKCGLREKTSSGLYFGFGNRMADTERYNTPAYGYHNYDLTTNGVWSRGYWATGYNGGSTNYTISNSLGELTMNVTEDYSGTLGQNEIYGPWLKLTNGHGAAPSKSTPTLYSLNYTPTKAKEIQIRFKLSDCTAVGGKTPTVAFEYYYLKNGEYKSALLSKTYSFEDGIYQTVTLPVNPTFTSADAICGFGFRFQHIKSAANGKLTVDFIHIGEESADTLFFDFKNDFASKQRYQNTAYNFYNFDLATSGFWTTGYNVSRTDYAISNSEGVLKVNVQQGYSSAADGSDVIYGPWLKTTNNHGKFTTRTSYDYYPLNYNPENAEYVQIRLKHTGCAVPSGKKPNLVLEFYYTENGIYNMANNITCSYTMDNGTYQILTFPVSSQFKSADEIECLGLRFQHVMGNPEGQIVIDYIYIGPQKDLPNDTYEVSFVDADGTVFETQTVLKGNSVIYSGATPAKAYDAINHYTFSGWDKDLTNIQADTVFAAQFDAQAHTLSYTSVDDDSHNSSCNCGYAISESHTIIECISKTPTCTSTGIKTIACPKCNLSKSEVLPKTDHVWKVLAAVAPTCTDGGQTEGESCSVCGEILVEQKAIDALGHSYKSVVTDPTCTEIGYTTYTCSRCRDSYVDHEIQAAGHSYDNGRITAPPNCTEEGIKTYTCLICGVTKNQTIAPHGHIEVKDGAVAPTCTESGLTEGKHCSVCKEVLLAQTEIAALGHSYDNGVITAEPTCTVAGTKTFTCHCGDTQTETIEKLNHKSTYVAQVAPTCTEDGHEAHYKCSRCEMTFVDEVCRYPLPVEYMVIPATGHSYTYTNNGKNHTVGCVNCDDSATEDHTYVDGKCICGANEPTEQFVETLKPSMSIVVGAEMSVAFTVNQSMVSKYESFYLVVEKDMFGAEAKTVTFGYGEGQTALTPMPNAANPFLHNASFTGLTAKEMGDEIRATLYCVDAEGNIFYGPTQADSVKDYLLRGLDLATSTPEKKTMYVDMLRYGAVAQTYFDYDTDNLVSDDLKEAHLAYATTVIPEAVDGSKAEGGRGTLNTSVVLKARVTLTLSNLKPGANLANMKFIVKDALDGTVIKELPAYNLNPVMVAADFDDVGAKQMRRLITVTLYDGDTAITDTVTWSVESYVAKIRATSTDAVQIDLVNAMLTYGDAVAAYMATQ